MLTYFVSQAYLRLVIHGNNPRKENETKMIKIALHAKMEAVSTDIIPLVDINSISFVSHDLEKNDFSILPYIK